jgi:tetratricopeptide (TPR) repeat protein
MKLSSNVKYFFLRVINMRTLQTSLLLFFLLQLSLSPVLAQGGVIQPSKTEAEAAWNAGRYESAFDHYNGLLLLYSRDPLYKYYTGACLVQLQRDIPRAAGLLSSAISSSAGVKSIPDDVWFWYGRSLQLNGDFTQASDAYSRFVKTAGRKISQEYEVQRYIVSAVWAWGEWSTGLRAQSMWHRARSLGLRAQKLRIRR